MIAHMLRICLSCWLRSLQQITTYHPAAYSVGARPEGDRPAPQRW